MGNIIFLDYIKKHESEIGIHKKQCISQIYENRISILKEIGNSEFQKVFKNIDINKPIGRGDVFNTFSKKGLYEGFIYAMLWGGLGVGKGGENLSIAMNTSKNEIEEKLGRVKNDLSKGNIENAFNSMNSAKGNNKIKGIGISYLTKLLYFLCESNNPSKSNNLNNNYDDLLPLIYDKWGRVIHTSFLIDLRKQDLFKYHFLSLTDYYGTNNRLSDFELYHDYLKLMAKESKSLNKKPGDLEEFLFGQAKVKNNKDTHDPTKNPRVFMEYYINAFCDSLIKGLNIFTGIEENELVLKDKKESKRGKKIKSTDIYNQPPKKQQLHEQPTIINYQSDYEALVKRNIGYRVFDNRERITGRTVYYGCELDNGLRIYVGKNKKGIFCSILGNNLTQEIKTSYRTLLPLSGKDWIAKYCDYNEAVETFNKVLEKLSNK